MKMATEYNIFESEINNEKMELDNTQRMNTEILEKLDLERTMLFSTIAMKEKEIEETENLVLKKLPQEFSNLEFLFNKEVEIYNKVKLEHNSVLTKNDQLQNELLELIKIYKETASINIEKTKEGFLKLIFLNLNTQGKESYIIVEIKEGNFRVKEIYPHFNTSQIEEELYSNHNFTLFITKIANGFLSYYNNSV